MESLHLILLDINGVPFKTEGYKKDSELYDWRGTHIEKTELLFIGSEEEVFNEFKKYAAQKNKTAEEIFLPKYASLQKQVGGGHYKDMVIPPAEYIIKNNIPWIEGDAIVYISRHSSKNGAEDLKKAIQCLEIALEFYYPNEAK